VRSGNLNGMSDRVLLSWSGGKDSLLALLALQRDPKAKVVGLLTVVDPERDRVAAHEVRAAWLRAQARSLGLPLHEVALPRGADNATYEAAFAKAVEPLREAGVTEVAFGDLFLEDIRRYRQRMIQGMELGTRFPLWQRDTRDLAGEFVAAGYCAWVVCVDTEQLDGRFAGRLYDARFLAELPDSVDPCGETGEFHTFVFNGPGFADPVAVAPEAAHHDGRFVTVDLEPHT